MIPPPPSSGFLADIERILIPEARIQDRVEEVAREVARDFAGRPIAVVGILTGSCLFLADLLRRVPLPLTVSCISVASYHGGTASSGMVSLRQTSLPDVAGRDVLLVDDILDSGRTLAAVRDLLLGPGGARSVRSCVLLRKKVPRAVPVEADYVCFDIPDEFVVGYGLDYREHYRNLPFVGTLTPEAIQRGPLHAELETG